MVGKYIKYIIAALFLMVVIPIQGQQEFYSSEYFIKASDTLNYRMLMPKKFDPSKQYPVILFLHGAGERGNDNKSQLIHGAKLFASPESRNNFQAIVVFPQCPKDDYWSNVKVDRSKKGLKKFKYHKKRRPTKSMKLVLTLMDSLVSKSYVNKNQVYVGGLSMGGMGTFDIVKRRSNMFAAAFPICGGGSPKSVPKYANKVAFWVFHGGEDNVVHPFFSLRMVSALQEKEGDVRLTYYENVNHNSWDAAFAEPQLLPWLFSNTKTSKNE